MTTQEVKRKLTAILSADVKGYSRLMGEDEKGTVRTLNAYKEVMTNLIQQHRGRVVDAPGDNVLAEFGSVVDAVECAVEIQKELKTRNAELPENRRMEFRIGVNLGDVIEDGEQILGDGVNIAARLESLSEAGSICISGTAFDHVRNKLDLGYEYLGEQTVKNIALPVRVYRVLMEPEAAGKVIGEKKVDVPSKDIELVCAICRGGGRDPFLPEPCRFCNGRGTVKVSNVDRKQCPYCQGRGLDPYRLSTCPTCRGLGRIPRES
jgi:adenylate cyclase